MNTTTSMQCSYHHTKSTHFHSKHVFFKTERLRLFSVFTSSCPRHTNSKAPHASSNEYEFTYVGNDGRKKATFEQAFKNINDNDTSMNPTSTLLAPWELGYQMSEKNLAWNDDLQSRLLARVAGEKLGLTDEQVQDRLEQLSYLLPELQSKRGMSANTLVRLLADIDHLPERLMNLKATFPGANVSKLAIRAPELVLGFGSEHLQSTAAILRDLLPTVDIDKLVEENPSVLDVEELQAAMAEAKRIMPSLDLQNAMQVDPQLILSFQRGSQLIPYDPPTPVNEDEEDDDDEYAAYYK